MSDRRWLDAEITDPFTRLDRAIIAAVQFGGGFTIGRAPDEDGWVRHPEGLIFRGVDVTDRVARLVILINGGLGDKGVLPKLRALLKQTDASPFTYL